jgi:hypothetical protein
MKLTLTLCTALALIVAIIGLAPVIGQDMGKKEPAPEKAEPLTKDPNGILKKVHGDWDCAFTMWMAPGADPTKFNAPMKSDWALDGQFLFTAYEMGDPMPHKGVEYFSYNDGTEDYESIRLTSMSGAQIVYKGKYDKEKKTLEVKAEYSGVWEGTKFTAKSRAVYVWETDNKYTCTVYSKYTGFEGMEEEMKEVEIICTRAKK